MASNNPTPPPISGRWKPGQSGNPGGRPKKKPITAALQKLFDKFSDADIEEFNKEMLKRAASGDVGAWKEVTDRLEGKVTTPIDSVNVTRIVSGWDE